MAWTKTGNIAGPAGAGGGGSSIAYDTDGVPYLTGVSGSGTTDFPDMQNAIGVPDAGMIRLFGRSVAHRMMLAQVGPSGLDTALQPFMARNKIGYWNPPGNATSVPGLFGFTAPSIVGTATTRNVTAVDGPHRMRRIGYVGAVTVGTGSAQYVSKAQFTGGSGANDGSGFFYLARFVPSNTAAVAGERFYIGMNYSVSAPANVEPDTQIKQVGLAQLSTDNTQFYVVYGGTTAQTAIPCGTDLGSPVGFSTDAYELAIFTSQSEVRTYYIAVTNIFTGATFTTTLSGTAVQVPDPNVLLAHRAWKSNNATALAVGFDICSIYLETDT